MKRDEFQKAFAEALKEGLIEQVGERNGEPTYAVTPKGDAWNDAYKREKVCREFTKELGL